MVSQLKELIQQKKCHLKLAFPLEGLNRLMEFWFNNPASIYNIEKNFSILQQKHEKYFSLIDDFIQSQLNVPNTLEELQKKIENLGHAQNDLAKALGDVVLADQSFAFSLDTLIIGLQKKKGDLEEIIKSSDYPELKQKFDEILSSIQSWIDKTSYIKVFVLEAGRKRSLVFEIVRDRIELFLESEFAKLSGQKLGDIRDQINSILFARDLMIEIENWWFNAAVFNGFGGGYLTKYLQFEKPLFIMRSDYAQGLSFEYIIDTMSSLPSSTKATLKQEVQYRLDILKAAIDKLVAGGWQAQLDRQKFLVQKRESIISSYPPACQSAINEYISKSKNVSTLLDFRIVEKSYKKVVESCKV